ncbi:hypothetical protein [Erythrobacter sp. JK5]|uniref:hypothetical protein n=1 Tax=Erythrobacter sp. JK5 TaxID=2829500 RepID=UPI001BAA8BF3|nr:hypothetical protein [Erythrobacter sp. JK5]QUL39189.1 hypothetical protein KDC96_07700 [Erythrobacter sp. JK5]
MTARAAQFGIAAVFLILGGWALLAPGNVIELGFTEPYRANTYTNRFIMAGFGAQAVLFGIMALVVRWRATAFLVFAALLLPFFVFNWYFHFEVPVLTSYGMIDFAGNTVMLVLAVIGWRAAKAEESRA